MSNIITIEQQKRLWNLVESGLYNIKPGDIKQNVDNILPPYMNDCRSSRILDIVATAIWQKFTNNRSFPSALKNNEYLCVEVDKDTGDGLFLFKKDNRHYIHIIKDMRCPE